MRVCYRQSLPRVAYGSNDSGCANASPLRSKGNALEEARKDILDIQLAEKSAREHHQAR